MNFFFFLGGRRAREEGLRRKKERKNDFQWIINCQIFPLLSFSEPRKKKIHEIEKTTRQYKFTNVGEIRQSKT